jgi:hypothetical protein
MCCNRSGEIIDILFADTSTSTGEDFAAERIPEIIGFSG